MRDFPVLSRCAALESLRDSIARPGSGLTLLTGEPGAGKTWLWRRFVRELGPNWRYGAVEISEDLGPVEFLQLFGSGLEIDLPERLGAARLALARALREEASDGRSCLLVLENAQNMPERVWDEVLALVHAMEAGEGLAGVLLVGTTALTTCLSARRLRAVATRVQTHVHLLPLDVDECQELARLHSPGRPLDRIALEDAQRKAGGNPRRFLQILKRNEALLAPAAPPERSAAARIIAGSLPQPAATPSDPVRRGAERGPAEDFADGWGERRQAAPDLAGSPVDSAPVVEQPLLPGRPPIRIEEGMVEVGWDGALESDEPLADTELTPMEPARGGEPDQLPGEEVVEDHYAALQAWSEWAENRARVPEGSLGDSGEPIPAKGGSEFVPSAAEAAKAPAGASSPGIRIEAQHEHAPYSQLFTRLRQAK